MSLKRISIAASTILVCALGATSLFAADKKVNAFYAMDTGMRGAEYKTPEARAALLEELGYPGSDTTGFNGLADTLKAYDARKLKLFAIYTGLQLDAENRTYEYDPKMLESLPLLEGKGTIIWLFVQAQGLEKSSPEGDALAVKALREIAGHCAKSGVRVALYPHTGFWIETVEDAVRVVKKVERKNVGATFNLCHWLQVQGEENMEALAKESAPHLFLATINGADSGAKGWGQLIQPLDAGTFDTGAFVKALHDNGFRGPIGLQAYGVKGDNRENLQRSRKAWRKIRNRIREQ